MYKANSPLNIFPLNFFIDAVVGFWDSQKKLVADRYPSHNVLYLGLRPTQIYDWYHKKYGSNDKDDEGLIAADGVHPNAKCYASWARVLAEYLVKEEPTLE
jgi:lysophospholipase L1-like esterase